MALQELEHVPDLRGLPNPHQDDPVPEYALRWGEGTHRPPILPKEYDIRIHPSAIFALSNSLRSDGSVQLVIPSPCNRCYLRNLEKYVCSREYPCNHCQKDSKECIYSRTAYAVLHQGDDRRILRARRSLATTSTGLRENLEKRTSVSEVEPSQKKRRRIDRAAHNPLPRKSEEKKKMTPGKPRKILGTQKRVLGRKVTSGHKVSLKIVRPTAVTRRKTLLGVRRTKHPASKKTLSKRQPIKSPRIKQPIKPSKDRPLISKSKPNIIHVRYSAKFERDLDQRKQTEQQ